MLKLSEFEQTIAMFNLEKPLLIDRFATIEFSQFFVYTYIFCHTGQKMTA